MIDLLTDFTLYLRFLSKLKEGGIIITDFYV